ncbi:unnamed protein product [Ostreobium quekettii]|uniref:Uncharacterized protein n=1 Tax=Ostreobium quekettii TaxID=121088 RepID=A0A8S1INB2_9CHLO|nr:unnamed protein product [Ostreobium quekettii]|eukprot:evm.model.scf_582.6 EVM.evm.TU.scf_582.6   scf_582:27912-32447(+)
MGGPKASKCGTSRARPLTRTRGRPHKSVMPTLSETSTSVAEGGPEASKRGPSTTRPLTRATGRPTKRVKVRKSDFDLEQPEADDRDLTTPESHILGTTTVDLHFAQLYSDEVEQVPTNWTVGRLKERMLSKLQGRTAEPSVRLLKRGLYPMDRPLEDDKTLKEQGVRGVCTVALAWPCSFPKAAESGDGEGLEQREAVAQNDDGEGSEQGEASAQDGAGEGSEQEAAEDAVNEDDVREGMQYKPQIVTPTLTVGVRTKWTDDEVWALANGVEKHGFGKWNRILNDNPVLRTRTYIQLKDKWRNISKVMAGKVAARSQQWSPSLSQKLHKLCE